MQRVAVVYNLRRSLDEHNYEFASERQIADIVDALMARHEVRPIEAPPRTMGWVSELENFAPDLVFNLAEGYASAAREAFYPALYEQLGLLYTGSDPTAMLVTHNKQLTKSVVQAQGVNCVKSVLLEKPFAVEHGCSLRDGDGCRLEQLLPAVVKPNTEGSSMGIHKHSIVRTHAELLEAFDYVTSTFRSLALMEEFIPNGVDLSASYVEGSSDTGVWDPIQYAYAGADMLDAETKNQRYERSILNVDVPLTKKQCASVRDAMQVAVKALGARGYARADFRVAEDGIPYFLEMNCMPVIVNHRSDFLNPLFTAGWSFEEIVHLMADRAFEWGERLPTSGGFTGSE
ncbi:MAG: D-alanine--D-alanine ligase family protein [Pseudonocardiaceae bacterium]